MLRTSDELTLEPGLLPLLSESYIDTSLPIQNGIQSDNRMTSISIFHATPSVWHMLAAKAGGFNLMMDNKSYSSLTHH